MKGRGRNGTAAFTLVEVSLSLAVTAIVLGSMAVSMQREAKGLAAMATSNSIERGTSQMLDRLGHELEYAVGANPQAFLMTSLSAGNESGFSVDASRGFPAWGILLLDPGTPAEERIAYADLVPSLHRFENLGRGAQCGSPQNHSKNALVRWAGMACPIDNQLNPSASEFDGVSKGAFAPIYFRGDGTGFSFRVPTMVSGSDDYIQNGEVTWGSAVGDGPSSEGWSALVYQAQAQFIEAQEGFDLDRDGDLEDVYDLGRIRMMSWNAYSDSSSHTDVALCPPIVLQRRCDWGGDLNNDGFDDPIFLWDPDTGRLRISLYVLPGRIHGHAAPRRVETTLYLRNGAWE